MKVQVEYGCRVRDTDVERIEVVEVRSIKSLYFDLKRKYITEHEIDGDANNDAVDYLNEFSEVCDVENTFYIGFEEGDYIEGWALI
tara:strand:+ start:390 stop:647 length:258 start_codon:yes stop_codon:yes gene_type:complete